MKYHAYGQKSLMRLPKSTTIEDLRALTWFNRVVKNYLKMRLIEKEIVL